MNLSTLFEKEMSRKEFLVLIGLGLATILGITSRIKQVSKLVNKTVAPKTVSKGFGKGAYGA